MPRPPGLSMCLRDCGVASCATTSRREPAAAYYGEGNSLALYLGGQLLNAGQIQVCNLSGVDGSWINLPAANSHWAASVDPELGRIALPPSASTTPPNLQVSFCYGFNADLGGGEYSREATFTVQVGSPLRYPDVANAGTTLQDVLNDAVTQSATAGSKVAVEITNSGVYTSPALSIDIPAGVTIELRAAVGARPTLILTGEIAVTGASSSTFALNGLLLQAAVNAPVNRPDGSNSQPDKPVAADALHAGSRRRPAIFRIGAARVAAHGKQIHRRWSPHSRDGDRCLRGQHRRHHIRNGRGLLGPGWLSGRGCPDYDRLHRYWKNSRDGFEPCFQ